LFSSLWARTPSYARDILRTSHREVRELVARHLVATGEVDKANIRPPLRTLSPAPRRELYCNTIQKDEVDEYAQMVRHSVELLRDHVDDGDREELLVSLTVSECRIGAE